MTEFEYTPIKKIIIHQLVKVDYDKFAETIVSPESKPAIYVDGVLFQYWHMPRSELITRYELQEQTRFYDLVEFAKCESKPSILKYNGMELGVVDVSSNPIFVDFAKWLKAQPIWSDGN